MSKKLRLLPRSVLLRRRLFAGTATLTAVVLAAPLSALTGLAPAVAEAPPAPSVQDPAQPRQLDRARREAVSRHTPVEVEAWTTETAQFFAKPDGKTMQAYLNTGPVRVKRAGQWHDIDTTLAEKDGILAPRVAKNGLQLSTGGSGPVVKLRHERGRSALLAPSTLPAPILAGDTATYRDAYGKGIDLAISATPTGFNQSVVFRERPRRKTTLSLQVQLPRGLSYAPAANGKTQLKEGKKKIADIPDMPMLDAAAMKGGPDDGHRAVAKVSTGGDASRLVLSADTAFLADPATQFPVTLQTGGSEWLGAGRAIDTFVSSTQYPNSQGSSTWLRAGKSSNGGETWRSYIGFQMDASFQLMGANILNADLRLWNYRSNACGLEVGSGILVRQVTQEWTPSTISWSTQPATTSSNQVINKAAYSDTCSWGEGELYYSIEGIAQAWANGEPDNGLQLRAVNESEATNWRQYRSAEYGYSAGTSGPRGPVLFIEFEPSQQYSYFQAEKPSSSPSQAEIDDIKSRETSETNPTFPLTDDRKIVEAAKSASESFDVNADTQETPPDLTPEELADLEDPDTGPGYRVEPDDPDASPSPTPTPTGSPSPTGSPGEEEVLELPLTSAITTTNWGYEEQGDPELAAGSYDWEDGTYDLSRTYLKFDTSALAGKTVVNAQLKLRNRYGYCPDGTAAIKASQVTGPWNEASLTWDSQPTTSTTQIGADSDPPCEDVADISWTVTPMASAWASGAVDHGIQLRAVPEAQPGSLERYFDSTTSEQPDPAAPVLSVTVVGPPATARTTSSAGSAKVKANTAAVPVGGGFMTEAECRQHTAEAKRPGVNTQTTFYPGGWQKDRFNWCAIRQVGMESRSWSTPQVNHYINGEATVRIRSYNAGKDKHERTFQVRVTINNFTFKGRAYPRWARVTLGMNLEKPPGTQRCQIVGQTSYTYHHSAWPNTEAVFTVTSVDDNDYDDLDTVAVCKPRFWSKVTSLTETVSARSYDTVPSIRCDSAAYLVSSIGAGCVVYYEAPTLTYGLSDPADPTVPSNDPNSTYRSVAGHVWTALNQPLKTIPHNPNKSIPGKSGSPSPLYRSVNATWNRASGRIIRAECDKLPDYDKSIRQCDEYPFNSTTSSASRTSNQSYSVRPVTKTVNSSAGGKLGRFLTNQRILGRDGSLQRDVLNWDPFYVNVTRPASSH
ncbi:DNRLRE domain-containing protein [Streptosporangium sp. NPDC001559]|uniref:DNRLRE domain-containing protein n=1 Tax=Streptosporangium sp. NPDC001559 TaxID=3366187 RepID=UPI0036E52FF6